MPTSGGAFLGFCAWSSGEPASSITPKGSYLNAGRLVHTQHRHDEADDPFRFAEHSFRESEQAFRQIEQPFRNTSVFVRLQPKRVFIFQRKPCSTSTEISVRLRRNTQVIDQRA